MKVKKLVILIILLIKRKMLKLYKNTFKTMLAFFLIFIHFLVIFSLFRGKTTLSLKAKYYYKLFLFSKMTQKKGVALNDLSIQVKNVI